ncbi:hypothetical protein ALP22_200156 [Pseudomonas coronafaciens pv. porri]|nr:hypothetical protein ALP22_200156 [Pseudomonas coronafaciens pv. porri]
MTRSVFLPNYHSGHLLRRHAVRTVAGSQLARCLGVRSAMKLTECVNCWLAAQTKIKSQERKRKDGDDIEDDEPF